MLVISLMKMISYHSNHNLLLISLTNCEIFSLLTLLSISHSDANLAFSFFHLIENSKRNDLFVSIKLCGSTHLPPKLKAQQNSFLNSMTMRKRVSWLACILLMSTTFSTLLKLLSYICVKKEESREWRKKLLLLRFHFTELINLQSNLTIYIQLQKEVLAPKLETNWLHFFLSHVQGTN